MTEKVINTMTGETVRLYPNISVAAQNIKTAAEVIDQMGLPIDSYERFGRCVFELEANGASYNKVWKVLKGFLGMPELADFQKEMNTYKAANQWPFTCYTEEGSISYVKHGSRLYIRFTGINTTLYVTIACKSRLTCVKTAKTTLQRLLDEMDDTPSPILRSFDMQGLW